MWDRLAIALCAALAAACGASSSGSPKYLPDPQIEMAPTGQVGHWAAEPVDDGLGEISNNGLGYTGEIDIYELTTPAPGRLQISLHWHHEADFDLIVAADREGTMRLAVGQEFDFEPEYVGLQVTGGQRIFLLVAGWDGDPGDYTLETVLLPPEAPLFALEELPDTSTLWPANRPMVFRFNVALDPDQDLEGRVYIVGDGGLAGGRWHAEGRQLVFYPLLPELPGERGGLHAGADYILQLRRAARGVRAVTGEYLSELTSLDYRVGPYLDPDPAQPPRVTAIAPPPTLPWNGSTVTVTISEALHPDTVFPMLALVEPSGREVPLAFRFTLEQQYDLSGGLEARLAVAPDEPLPPASRFRLRLPGTILGLSGDPLQENRLTGPAPQPGGLGYEVDFRTP